MNKIVNEAKNFFGNVLCIGVSDDKILSALNINKKINVFTIDRIIGKSIFSRRKKVKTNTGKKINIKKLRKTFKKKSIDYMICDLNGIYEYFKYFIGDSIIINKGLLYIYGTSEFIDPNVIANRYKRYGATIKVEVDNENFVIIVDNKNSKTNWLKNRLYVVVDTFHNASDMISTALIS